MPDEPTDRERDDSPVAAWRMRLDAYASLGARVLLFVAAFAAVNALRRNANSRLLWDEPDAWLEDLAWAFVSGMLVALPVVAGVMAAFPLVPRHRIARALSIVAIVAMTSAAGTLALAWWEAVVTEVSDLPMATTFAMSWLRYAILGLLFAWAYAYFRDRQEARAAMYQSETDRAEFERRVGEARLLVLQAQIEPHFLFNTLAHVKRLYETDPRAAQGMLANLKQYIAVALPRMREPFASLHSEVGLAEAYLELQRTRMGRRLAFAIDLPPSLRDAQIPTMMVLTLVENAIKHGIAPLREGGAIRIAASAAAQTLSVDVADSGRGFVASSGGGAGLANLRTRLAILYGAHGRLDLRVNAPRGVIATLALPLDIRSARPREAA